MPTQRKHLRDLLLVVVLVALTLLVGLAGPPRVSRWLTRAFDLRLPPETVTGIAVPHADAGLTVSGGKASVDLDRVRSTLNRFAHVRSRVPGYGELGQAAEYIRDRLRAAGVEDVTIDTFQVTVPVDLGGRLRLAEGTPDIELHALWPNGVRTPTTPAEGISGALVDGGDGSLEAIAGTVVEGSVILLGFGTGDAYLTLRSLGAAAIVFYDDGQVTREQAADKMLRVPADVPRYWIGAESARLLRRRLAVGESLRAELHSRMEWRTVDAYNVYGLLPGTDPDAEVIALSAYYDGVSVVPALAPAAEAACSITALLELADVVSRRPSPTGLLLVATSAHFQGLAGINDFLYRHARGSDYFRERMDTPLDFHLFLGLDLSSGNDQVAAFSEGVFYDGWDHNGYVKNLMAPYARRFLDYQQALFNDERARYVDAVAPSKQSWKDFMPVGLPLEGEAPVFVGLSGMSLATPDDLRSRIDTPVDEAWQVDVEALTRQVQTLAGLLQMTLEDEGFFTDTELTLKDRGHALGGSVYWFNRDVNFAVPKDPIRGAVVTYPQPGLATTAGVRMLHTTMTDSVGKFRFDVLGSDRANRILAYKLDDAGRITWAPDLGIEGDAAFPVSQNYVWWEDEMVQVLFPCRALTLLQTVDTGELVALDHAKILGAGDAPPTSWGRDIVTEQSKVQGKASSAVVIYARPASRVKVLMSTGLAGVEYLLTDSPDKWLDEPLPAADVDVRLLDTARGRGVNVDVGLVPRSLYAGTGDMWVLNDVRLKILQGYGVRNERVTRLHERARDALLRADAALERNDYVTFTAATREAAGLESRAYPDVKATADDTVNGVVFYFVLLLPFAFFVERLLFGFADIRAQLAGFAGVFLTVFTILHLVHPAFKLSSSPYIILLAFVILAMGTTVVFLLVTRFQTEIRSARAQMTGIHDVDVGRLSASFAAVLLGISNLRKRKVRTLLTAITLILLSFTALSFTSVRSTIQFYELPRDAEAVYDGALVRHRTWRGLQPVALEYVQSAFGGEAVVAPRAWYLMPSLTGRTHVHFHAAGDAAARSNAFGVVGLHADEPAVTGVDEFLVAGRWFLPGERRVCLLPEHLGRLVGIGPGQLGTAAAVIRMLGHDYRVVGLVDGDALNGLRDLDGERLTPVDMVAEGAAVTSKEPAEPTASLRAFKHLDAGNVLFLPVDEVLEMGGSLRSIAIAGYRASLETAVQDFVTRVSLPIFVGQHGATRVFSSMGAASLSGFGSLVVPLVIAGLIVLNTMLGSVYERIREIGIFSSLGLTPTHVAALFLAEASVFATVGAVMGYLIGQVLAMTLSATGLLEGISLNYSSLSAVSATLVVMVTVFLSTAYPAKRAADLTVPDVTRRWSFGEPEGDRWIFDFPFTVPGREVRGLYGYLEQVFQSYGEGSIGEFLTESVERRESAGTDPEEPRLDIALDAWLAPYDLGISQRVNMAAVPTGEHHIYRIEMRIDRLSGDVASWMRINRGFLNALRKRFLVWRTLPLEVKESFALAERRTDV